MLSAACWLAACSLPCPINETGGAEVSLKTSVYRSQFSTLDVPSPSFMPPPPPLAVTLCLQVWEDGQAFKDLQARLAAIAEQRESIEAARKVGRGIGPVAAFSSLRACCGGPVCASVKRAPEDVNGAGGGSGRLRLRLGLGQNQDRGGWALCFPRMELILAVKPPPIHLSPTRRQPSGGCRCRGRRCRSGVSRVRRPPPRAPSTQTTGWCRSGAEGFGLACEEHGLNPWCQLCTAGNN